jgi:hypothetical protein
MSGLAEITSCAQEHMPEPGQPMIVCREAGIRNLESAVWLCSKRSRSHAWLFRDVVLTTPSDKPGTLEMNELSLAIRTPRGLAVVVGCSHPGVEKILANAARVDPKLYTVTGGFHLVVTPEPEVKARSRGSIRPAQGRTSRPRALHQRTWFFGLYGDFQARFDPAGVGAVIALP